MNSGELRLDPVLTGKAFAEADSREQAAFLNSLGRHLQLYCKNSLMGEQMQLAYVVDDLDGNGAWLVKELDKSLDALAEVQAQAKEKIPNRDGD